MSKFHRVLDHRRRDLSFQDPGPVITGTSTKAQATSTNLLMFSLSREQSTDITAMTWRAMNGARPAYVVDPR
jgi:hypothetical protein